MPGDESCAHLIAIQSVKHAVRRECAECVKTGSAWLHLRTCQSCGATHCCDSSPNRHATKHARASGHPVVASAEPGERWLYCYPDEAFAEYEIFDRDGIRTDPDGIRDPRSGIRKHWIPDP